MLSSATPAAVEPWRLSARLAEPPRRLALAQLPTPVERATWLDAPDREVWIKRDDRSSSVYGGGKVRKLEWILGNEPYNDSRPILSVGGTGSHHLVALALFLQQLQRQLHALVFVQPWTMHTLRNFAVLVSTETKLWHVASRIRLPLAYLRYQLRDRPPVRGVWMPPGASTDLGCLGFVEAGLELKAQVDQGLLPSPDVIYITAGTAGTCAGLALGLALAGMRTRVHVVSSVEPWAFNRWFLTRKIAETHGALRRAGLPEAQHCGPRRWLSDAGITFELDHDQVGGGYGVPTVAAQQARDLAQAHGLALETTYTAKCLSALLRHRSEGRPESVLFWNTHGGNNLDGRIDPGWEQRSPIHDFSPLRADMLLPSR